MPVFISYKHLDRKIAMYINEMLTESGIKTYIDVLDEESKNTTDITDVITKNISNCTHLIAVISEKTASSWWVPFEIGEATITFRRIASFQSDSIKLPEYLDKWPKMRTTTHLDMFINSYKNEDSGLRGMFESVGDGVKRKLNRNDADAFHSTLKNKISIG